MKTQAMVSELQTLRLAVAAHRAKIVAAQELRDEAVEAAGIPVQYGRYQIDYTRDGWRYPSVQAALDMVEALSNDNGYFWACSRLTDLERLLGESVPQLPLRIGNYIPLLGGDIPEADGSVTGFLAAA